MLITCILMSSLLKVAKNNSRVVSLFKDTAHLVGRLDFTVFLFVSLHGNAVLGQWKATMESFKALILPKKKHCRECLAETHIGRYDNEAVVKVWRSRYWSILSRKMSPAFFWFSRVIGIRFFGNVRSRALVYPWTIQSINKKDLKKQEHPWILLLGKASIQNDS